MTDLMLPSRRNVVRTAAWTVPVVATTIAAPSFAASCASTTYDWRLDWGATGNDLHHAVPSSNGIQTGDAVITGAAGTTPMAVTFRSEMFGSMQRDGDNLRLSSGLARRAPPTWAGEPGARSQHLARSTDPVGQRANRQEVQISFNRAVTNLSFTITDIDIEQRQTGATASSSPGLAPCTAAGRPRHRRARLTPGCANSNGNAGNGSDARNLAVELIGPAHRGQHAPSP